MTILFDTNRKSHRPLSMDLTLPLGILLRFLISRLTINVTSFWPFMALALLAGFHFHRQRLGAIALLAAVASLPGCRPAAQEVETPRTETAVIFTDDELVAIHTLSPLPPLAPDPTNRYADDPSAARFGQRVFYDPRFSADGSIACASCHAYAKGFGEGGTLARGLGPLTRHAMALWNVAYSDWFFWDGRVDTLWGQALEPLEEPAEHGTTRLAVVHVVHDDPLRRAEYEAIFGPLPELDDEVRFPPSGRPDDDDPAGAAAWAGMTDDDRHAVNVAFANVGKALAAYQRKLVSRRASFDIYVEGLLEGDAEKLTALDESAQRGLKLFVGRANCLECHAGPNFSTGSFRSNGVPPLDGGTPTDAGRYEGIARVKQGDFTAGGRYSDADPQTRAAALDKVQSLAHDTESWGAFKIPTLRNVALSPPYMHQGQQATLMDALRHYNTLENSVLTGHHAETVLTPLGLTDDELADLEAFLQALTDEAIDPALRGPLHD